ncbi:F-box protein PP2-B11-like [Apium graveolens]|uniref:F-box protein PP2-B11-like n=1 Tax=Apium graveolens TaxID=4045 RepID=UPI003D797D19
MGDMDALPQELMEKIVSRTRSVDAGGSLSIVSESFQSAAISDNVWSTFLPVDLISRRTLHSLPNPDFDDPWNNIDSSTLQDFPTNKDLYLFLSDNPLIIDDGAMCFWLDKISGIRCFHLFPRTFSYGKPYHFLEHCCYQKRIGFAPELSSVYILEICGKISTSLLSPDTTYTAYLMFDITNFYFGGFGEEQPLETYVGTDGGYPSDCKTVYIPKMPYDYDGSDGSMNSDRPILTDPQYPQIREKGTRAYHVELGDYFNKKSGDKKELKMSLSEVKSAKEKLVSLF